jgi:hypothetical protein
MGYHVQLTAKIVKGKRFIWSEEKPEYNTKNSDKYQSTMKIP